MTAPTLISLTALRHSVLKLDELECYADDIKYEILDRVDLVEKNLKNQAKRLEGFRDERDEYKGKMEKVDSYNAKLRTHIEELDSEVHRLKTDRVKLDLEIRHLNRVRDELEAENVSFKQDQLQESW